MIVTVPPGTEQNPAYSLTCRSTLFQLLTARCPYNRQIRYNRTSSSTILRKDLAAAWAEIGYNATAVEDP